MILLQIWALVEIACHSGHSLALAQLEVFPFTSGKSYVFIYNSIWGHIGKRITIGHSRQEDGYSINLQSNMKNFSCLS